MLSWMVSMAKRPPPVSVNCAASPTWPPDPIWEKAWVDAGGEKAGLKGALVDSRRVWPGRRAEHGLAQIIGDGSGRVPELQGLAIVATADRGVGNHGGKVNGQQLAQYQRAADKASN